MLVFGANAFLYEEVQTEFWLVLILWVKILRHLHEHGYEVLKVSRVRDFLEDAAID